MECCQSQKLTSASVFTSFIGALLCRHDWQINCPCSCTQFLALHPHFGINYLISINGQVWPTINTGVDSTITGEVPGVQRLLSRTGDKSQTSLGKTKFLTGHCPVFIFILSCLASFEKLITHKYSDKCKTIISKIIFWIKITFYLLHCCLFPNTSLCWCYLCHF